MPFQITATTHVPKTAVQQRVAPPKPLQFLGKAAIAAGLAASLTLAGTPARADLNKFEYNAGGEFGVGTALQYGEADLKNRDFHNQDLTRSNFTAADCRNCNFRLGVFGAFWCFGRTKAAYVCSGCFVHILLLDTHSNSKLTATYFIKSVLYKANFEVSALVFACVDVGFHITDVVVEVHVLEDTCIGCIAGYVCS